MLIQVGEALALKEGGNPNNIAHIDLLIGASAPSLVWGPVAQFLGRTLLR